MNMIELKPCPFCGSEAKLYVSECGVCVMCTGGFKKGCGCKTSWYRDDYYLSGLDDWNDWSKAKKTAVDKAIESWNRRET